MSTVIGVKVTDNTNHTNGGGQGSWVSWQPGVTQTVKGNPYTETGRSDPEPTLCTEFALHFYADPLHPEEPRWEALVHLALVCNRFHACYGDPHLWKVRAEGRTTHDETKWGALSLTPLEPIERPDTKDPERFIRVMGIFACRLAMGLVPEEDCGNSQRLLHDVLAEFLYHSIPEIHRSLRELETRASYLHYWTRIVVEILAALVYLEVKDLWGHHNAEDCLYAAIYDAKSLLQEGLDSTYDGKSEDYIGLMESAIAEANAFVPA